MFKRLIKRLFSRTSIDRGRLLFDRFLPYTKLTCSQFGEDLFIREYFSGKDDGFYVDVGAFHPRQLSNTCYLYELGWRGINIEANPLGVKLFRQVRPRDINVQAAVSDEPGRTVEFHSWGIHAENSMHPGQVQGVARNLGEPREVLAMKTVTLASILEQYCSDGEVIDFMTVDVEGHDLQVLRSNDWSRYRPLLLAVEQFADNIDQVLGSGLYGYLTEMGYELAAWYRPTLFFSDRRQEAGS